MPQIHRYSNGTLPWVHTVATPDWGPAQVRWTSTSVLRFRKVSVECVTAGIDTSPEVELARAGPAL